ncbi:MAG: hypothetical protein ACK56I_24960, partial [bacterium]
KHACVIASDRRLETKIDMIQSSNLEGYLQGSHARTQCSRAINTLAPTARLQSAALSMDNSRLVTCVLSSRCGSRCQQPTPQAASKRVQTFSSSWNCKLKPLCAEYLGNSRNTP